MTNTNVINAIDETKEYFNSRAFTWDNYSKPDYGKINGILRIAGVKPGKRILDVACGTGILFPFLMEYAPEYLRAIDLSLEMVHIANKKYQHPCLEVTNENFYTFDEYGFDYLIVYNAYPHFLDKNLFAEKAYQCLKPEGRLIIAHGSSRSLINSCHMEKKIEIISAPLASCCEEAAHLRHVFEFDVMVDTEELYILSGTRW